MDNYVQMLAEKLGMQVWSSELLAMRALRRITELETALAASVGDAEAVQGDRPASAP